MYFAPHELQNLSSGLIAGAPQDPQNFLEEILTDADLDILGYDDFMFRNSELRCELAFFGKEYIDQEWYSNQLKFLESHTYFTASARSLRDAGNLKNIRELRNRLEEIQ